jgi:hypothetical protein
MRHKLGMVVVGVAVCLCLSSASRGDIGLTWASSMGAYGHGGVWNPPVGVYPNGFGLRQLIWSSVNPASLLPDLGGLNYLDSNSYLLRTYSAGFDPDGAIWSASAVSTQTLVFGNADVGGHNINNGYLYSRIFQDTVPTQGMWFYQSVPTGSTFAVYDFMTPSTIINYDSTVGGPFELNSQIAVPEPATWAFMGLGALVMFVRRRMTRA